MPTPSFPLVGVVGAGVMGRGLAQDLAEHRHEVVLLDRTDEVLDEAMDAIRETLRFRRLTREEPPEEDVATVADRITTTTEVGALGAVDFLVENVTEQWPVKRDLYPRLDQACDVDVVFAANTSCISITRIAGQTQRPDRVLGMHFMNPVPKKPTVEVIRGYHTTDDTVSAGEALLGDLDKEGVVVDDMPGFVTNRVLMLTINEAIFTLQDGVAETEKIDRIFEECFGHEMGPLRTADLIGLDTILDSLQVLYDSYDDPKYRPAPLLKKYVHAGRCGRKSGEGFYSYASSPA
jgi:3-hydroxybutyryl-CoA dehydrogenase